MPFSPPEADEFSFIFDSWANSWMKSPWSGTFRNCDYQEMSRKSFSEIIDRPTTVVTVMWTGDADSRRIVGYAVTEPSRKIIHWLYVKRDFRGFGSARRLLDNVLGDSKPTEWIYTHRTNACSKLFRGMRHDKAPACVKG